MISSIKSYIGFAIKSSRPNQLLAVTLVYGWGSLLARAKDGTISGHRVWWGYAAIFFVAASIHYANEYSDHETDSLAIRTPFSGGSGALQTYGFSHHFALIAAWISLVIGTGVALVGWYLGKINLLALGTLTFGALFGWMYSLPPLKLAWRGLGEIDNALLGGMVLPVYAYTMQRGQIDPFVIYATLPFALVVFINLLATTWPDREADIAVGKRTLATQWMTKWLRVLYIFVAVTAFLLIWFNPVYPPLVVWGSLVTIPIVLWGSITYTRWHSPFPTVAAMVVLVVSQILTWSGVVFLGM